MSNIKEESKKQVPLKNYVYLFFILLGSLLLLFYIYSLLIWFFRNNSINLFEILSVKKYIKGALIEEDISVFRKII